MFCDPSYAYPCGSCTLTLIVAAAAAIGVLCLPLSYLVLGRPFDRLVGQGTGFEYWSGALGTLAFRPMIFALLVVVNPDWERIERRKGRERIENDPAQFFIRNYRGIDYRRASTTLQAAFSWVYVGSTVLMFALGSILLLCDKLGWVGPG